MRVRFVGHFRPPLDVDANEFPSLSGPGWCEVGPEGLMIGATVMNIPAKVPWRGIAAGVALLGVVLVVIQVIPIGSLAVFLTVSVAMSVIPAFLERQGVSGQWSVGWAGIERIVLLPSDDTVVAMVLVQAPAPMPDLVYFVPEGGPGALLREVRQHAPTEVPVETEAAARQRLENLEKEEAEDEDDEDEPPGVA